MARTDEIKFIDQHLEKVVLGVCVLILAYGVFQWVLSAPPRPEVPEVDGEVVSATEVDAEMRSWAERVEGRKPSGGPLPPVYDYTREIEKHRKPTGIASIDNWGDHRQVMVPPKRVKPPEGIPLKRITDILDAFAPKFTEIKGARELVDERGGIDKLVFRGQAEFPLGALLKAWNKVFRGSAMDEVLATAVAVEIEKREVLSDGTFGPVTRVARVQIPIKAGETAVPAPDVVIPQYTGENADAVRKAILEFSQKTQARILRPDYWNVWAQVQGVWRWAKPWIKAEEKPAPVAPAGAAPAAGAGAAPAVAVGNIDDGTTELWFHDTDVVVQREYSYRMRIVFVSPLYTYDNVVYKGSPKDALVKAINSKWSEWVQAEAIPRTTQYFVTSVQGMAGMGGKQRLYCTVFTRSLGQVVSHRFAVSPGHIIGGKQDKQIRNPSTGKSELRSVDFSTNATAIYIDFSKKITRLGRPDETRELTCLERGKLVSHIQVKHIPAADARAKAFKMLQALVGGRAP
ncbi:MAG: hypothetical protein QGH60_09485 [Phycisphaerae bacterium]|jgi:hypothetical protein|nr:hypothetical protein [Phycisphaerae bacterium]